MTQPAVEPWLRGPLPEVPVAVMPLFFSFMLVREDLARFTGGLTVDQVWCVVPGNAPLGFQIRHIGGSIDRLLTYLEGGGVSAAQLGYLKAESDPGAPLHELLAELHATLAAAEQRLLRLDTSDLYAPRTVGRKRLPTTVIGLLVHIAEHTQRHLGQAITTAKLLRHS